MWLHVYCREEIKVKPRTRREKKGVQQYTTVLPTYLEHGGCVGWFRLHADLIKRLIHTVRTSGLDCRCKRNIHNSHRKLSLSLSLSSLRSLVLVLVLRVRHDVRQNPVAQLVVRRLVRHEVLPDVLNIHRNTTQHSSTCIMHHTYVHDRQTSNRSEGARPAKVDWTHDG